MTWTEKSQTLTIGDRKDSYDGMIDNRQFRVKLISKDKEKTISYNSKKQKVSFK